MDLVSFEWYVDSDSFSTIFPVEVVAYLAADSVCPWEEEARILSVFPS